MEKNMKIFGTVAEGKLDVLRIFIFYDLAYRIHKSQTVNPWYTTCYIRPISCNVLKVLHLDVLHFTSNKYSKWQHFCELAFRGYNFGALIFVARTYTPFLVITNWILVQLLYLQSVERRILRVEWTSVNFKILVVLVGNFFSKYLTFFSNHLTFFCRTIWLFCRTIWLFCRTIRLFRRTIWGTESERNFRWSVLPKDPFFECC